MKKYFVIQNPKLQSEKVENLLGKVHRLVQLKKIRLKTIAHGIEKQICYNAATLKSYIIFATLIFFVTLIIYRG